MMLLTTFLLIFLGFIYLSLVLPRHYSQVSNSRNRLTKSQQRQLKCIGFSCLILSLALAIMIWGSILGSVYWFAIVSVDGLILSMILSYKAQWLRFILPLNTNIK